MNELFLVIFSVLVSSIEPTNAWCFIALDQAGSPLTNAWAAPLVLGPAARGSISYAGSDGVIRLSANVESLGVLVRDGRSSKMIPTVEIRTGVTNIVVMTPDPPTEPLSAPFQAVTGSTLRVKVENCSLYEKPSFVASTLDRLEWKEEIMLLAQTQRWLYVRYLSNDGKSIDGWVHSSCVEIRP